MVITKPEDDEIINQNFEEKNNQNNAAAFKIETALK